MGLRWKRSQAACLNFNERPTTNCPRSHYAPCLIARVGLIAFFGRVLIWLGTLEWDDICRDISIPLFSTTCHYKQRTSAHTHRICISTTVNPSMQIEVDNGAKATYYKSRSNFIVPCGAHRSSGTFFASD